MTPGTGLLLVAAGTEIRPGIRPYKFSDDGVITSQVKLPKMTGGIGLELKHPGYTIYCLDMITNAAA